MNELEMKRLQITLRSDVLERLDALALEMGVKRSVVLSLLINEKWKEEHTDGKEKALPRPARLMGSARLL